MYSTAVDKRTNVRVNAGPWTLELSRGALANELTLKLPVRRETERTSAFLKWEFGSQRTDESRHS